MKQSEIMRCNMEFDHILKLIDAVSDSSLTGFRLDDGTFKLTFEANRQNEYLQSEQNDQNEFHIVVEDANESNDQAEWINQNVVDKNVLTARSTKKSLPKAGQNTDRYSNQDSMTKQSSERISECDAEQNGTDGSGHANEQIVKSPLVGVYYEAAGPNESPYVQIGDRVKKGQVLGIVEAMKLMNEIESDYDGKVTNILVENGQMVEYHQPLFVIEP